MSIARKRVIFDLKMLYNIIKSSTGWIGVKLTLTLQLQYLPNASTIAKMRSRKGRLDLDADLEPRQSQIQVSPN
jgi:hypothetical protein